MWNGVGYINSLTVSGGFVEFVYKRLKNHCVSKFSESYKYTVPIGRGVFLSVRNWNQIACWGGNWPHLPPRRIWGVDDTFNVRIYIEPPPFADCLQHRVLYLFSAPWKMKSRSQAAEVNGATTSWYFRFIMLSHAMLISLYLPCGFFPTWLYR